MNQESLFVGPTSDPDRYQIWSRIGSGGEGEVWLGTRELTDGTITVAIKAYHPSRLGVAESIESLIGRVETQVARLHQLHDPGIAAVHESFVGNAPHHRGTAAPGTNGPIVYLVMKYIDGAALSDWRADGLSPAGRLGVLNDVAAALDALHRTGQVHGDIKPSNLIVETLDLPDGRSTSRAVLVDFGVMRQVVQVPPSRVVGTRGFVAPELYEHGAYSQASDFYAFACVCAWLVCGGPPGHDVAGGLRAAGLSEDIVQTLLGGLHVDPNARSQQLGSGIAGWLSSLQSDLSTSHPLASTATEVSPLAAGAPTTPGPGPQAVGAAPDQTTHLAPVGSVGLSHPTQPYDQPATGPEPRRRTGVLVWLAVVGALVIVVGFLAFQLLQQSGDDDPTTQVADGASSTDAPADGPVEDGSVADISSDDTDTPATGSVSSTTSTPTTTTAPTTTSTSTTTTTEPPPSTIDVTAPTRVGQGIRFGAGFGIDLDSDAVDWGRTRNQFTVDIRVNSATFNDRFLTSGDVTVVSGEPNRLGCQDPSAEILGNLHFDRLEDHRDFCIQTDEGGWAWLRFIEFDAAETTAAVDIWYWES